MKIKLTAAFAAVPEKLLLPLKEAGFLERFTTVEISMESGLDALLPAPCSDEDLAMLAIDMCHFWSECIGPPSRTSLTACWLPGDILFSAEWTSDGWVLEVGYYRYHPAVEHAAIGVRIKRAKPGSTLKLVHSNVTEPAL